MARSGADGPKGISAFVVQDGAEGLSFGGLEEKMGWRSQPTRQVQLDKCNIKADALLGLEGQGFTYAMSACSLGAAQAALDQTVAYMGERKAFGQTIDQFQGLQFRLADMEIALQAARTFLRQAAWKLDAGAPDASVFCAMAKKHVTMPATAWRLWIFSGLRHRKDRARPARASNSGRHKRDYARADRPAYVGEMTDVLIRIDGVAGRITLNRPQALNALTWEMLLAIEAALDAWRDDPAVKLVIIDAAGDKAFCAGGDIAQMYATGKAGDFAYGQRFWRDEYRLNRKIYHYAKPVVSFLQGFTMGGGVGVGCHGSHRIVGETAQIAMPEVARFAR